MEMTENKSYFEKAKNYFFKDKSFFSKRKEINWTRIKNCMAIAVVFGVLVLLIMPEAKNKNDSFHEDMTTGSGSSQTQSESSPTQDALDQLNSGGSRRQNSSLEYLYDRGGSSASPDATNVQNGSMILSRGGVDAKNQVPPGSRIFVRLYEKIIVANQGMPVIGIATKDFTHEDSLAIPSGSKLFGTVIFEDGENRVKVDWRSIQFADGRERPFSAIGVGTDGQVGVKGRVHSDALMNTAGQTLTRFIGAYAEGSMQKGSLGANQGGTSNGFKNAISDTAKDRADKWATDLKKEKKWIEVSNTTEFYAVLTQNFSYRDPGSIYGR